MGIKLSEKSMERKKAYDKQYAKKNFKGKYIVFNLQYPEDMALLEWTNAQPEAGNQYIKRLIREDMERRKEENV